jgi:hypothetical protein
MTSGDLPNDMQIGRFFETQPPRRASGHENRVRVKPNFLNQIKLIWVVQSHAKKYSALP